ncbi:MAG: MarC family protein [Betaproteobacteria bacterium]|nr:MarC family protein [Betaproteobacteria bacterium]
MWVLLLKKIVTLFALVGPFGMIPLFLQATDGLALAARRNYARLLGVTVAVALVGAGLIGVEILELLGLSLGGMRVGGGIIVLILAIAMVLGQEKAVKQTAAEASAAAHRQGRGIVPLGIPLLAGPGALSYMMTHGPLHQAGDVALVVIPGLVVGAITWATFYFSGTSQRWLTPAMLNVIERLTGFLLAGLAIDMMSMGLKELFPLLAG